MTGPRPSRVRRAALAACLLAVAVVSSACAPSGATDTYASTETYGARFAADFSDSIPFRRAFTADEGRAADAIAAELEKLGYEPEAVFFDAAGETVPAAAGTAVSRNLVVTKRGTGFRVTDEKTGQTKTVRRTLLLCAHYDTLLGASDAEAAPGFDGIQDNASGVGALLQAARALKDGLHGFDVAIAFFGAGNAGQLGARNYLAGLSADELAALEAVYCVESIYAGDKLYANAGWTSLQPGRKYAMRKKLYETTDLAIRYSIDLRTNQAGFEHDLLGTGTPALFREVSSNRSDWVPFDEKEIPVVFFESYDFFADSFDKLTESRNPAFAATSGRIRGTSADSLDTLQEILEADRLKDRIDKVAFLLQKVVERGIDEGVAPITPVAASPTPAATEAPAS